MSPAMLPEAGPSRDRLVHLTEERIYNGGATDFPGHLADEEDDEAAWDTAAFARRLQIDVLQITDDAIDFDLVGVDASIANALRRCLMAEVPSVAVDTAYIYQNTSLIQDEVLAHRLAFVPLHINPTFLRFREKGSDVSDTTTVVFKLDIRCSHRRDAPPAATDPEELYDYAHVYSSALEWDPRGDQREVFAQDPPRPVHSDILLAKLRPGQEICVELHCELGRGKDHAKWSPVATASYRLMPRITILKPIPPDLCDTFAGCFPAGVTRVAGQGSAKTVTVVDPRKDTVSREVLRHPVLQQLVRLDRVRDHFIFSIESTGAYPPDQLLPRAIDEMLAKVRAVRLALKPLYSQ